MKNTWLYTVKMYKQTHIRVNTRLARFMKTRWLYTVKMYKQTHIRVMVIRVAIRKVKSVYDEIHGWHPSQRFTYLTIIPVWLVTPPTRRVWRSFKFAPFLFFFPCRKSGYRSWVIPLCSIPNAIWAHVSTTFKLNF